MRPIDADALEFESGTDPRNPTADMCFIRLEDVYKAPTIEPEYVKLIHGKWTPVNIYCNHAREFKCSACGESVYYDHDTRFCEYDFCPNCGACMDE